MSLLAGDAYEARVISHQMVYIDLLIDTDFTEEYTAALHIPGKKDTSRLNKKIARRTLKSSVENLMAGQGTLMNSVEDLMVFSPLRSDNLREDGFF